MTYLDFVCPHLDNVIRSEVAHVWERLRLFAIQQDRDYHTYAYLKSTQKKEIKLSHSKL